MVVGGTGAGRIAAIGAGGYYRLMLQFKGRNMDDKKPYIDEANNLTKKQWEYLLNRPVLWPVRWITLKEAKKRWPEKT